MRLFYATACFLLTCTISCAKAQTVRPSTGGQAPEPGHADPTLNLAMGQWRFVSIGDVQVASVGRQQPYLKFEERNHTVTGFTGCNRLRGSYQADTSTLTMKQVVSTRMACVGENYERQVLDVINSATGFKIIGQELHLLGAGGGELAVLVRPHGEQTTQQKPLEK